VQGGVITALSFNGACSDLVERLRTGFHKEEVNICSCAGGKSVVSSPTKP
jgi:hypothetical protein